MSEVVVLNPRRVKRDAPSGTGWEGTKTRDGEALDRRSGEYTHNTSGRAPRDRRYGLSRWQRAAKRVLNRDRHVCQVVVGCPVRATAADHIIPVFPGMPDSLFFGMGNLRASCRDHNLARGHVSKLEPIEPTGPSDVVTKDYSA